MQLSLCVPCLGRSRKPDSHAMDATTALVGATMCQLKGQSLEVCTTFDRIAEIVEVTSASTAAFSMDSSMDGAEWTREVRAVVRSHKFGAPLLAKAVRFTWVGGTAAVSAQCHGSYGAGGEAEEGVPPETTGQAQGSFPLGAQRRGAAKYAITQQRPAMRFPVGPVVRNSRGGETPVTASRWFGCMATTCTARVEVEEGEEEAVEDNTFAQIRQDLQALGLSELQSRSVEEGCDEPSRRAAVDSDQPKLALIELIIAHRVHPSVRAVVQPQPEPQPAPQPEPAAPPTPVELELTSGVGEWYYPLVLLRCARFDII